MCLSGAPSSASRWPEGGQAASPWTGRRVSAIPLGVYLAMRRRILICRFRFHYTQKNRIRATPNPQHQQSDCRARESRGLSQTDPLIRKEAVHWVPAVAIAGVHQGGLSRGGQAASHPHAPGLGGDPLPTSLLLSQSLVEALQVTGGWWPISSRRLFSRPWSGFSSVVASPGEKIKIIFKSRTAGNKSLTHTGAAW